MAEPRIQYCTTSDGVSIAYWMMGSGPVLVQGPGGIFSSLAGLLSEETQRWRDRLGQRNTLLRFDHRGFGQSQRVGADISLDTLTLDLEAVVDQLDEERVALLGFVRSGPVAIRYASRHPERVSHLVLYSSSARGETFFWGGGPHQQAIEKLAEADWETYTELLTHMAVGWNESDLARRYAAKMREDSTREALQAGIDAVCRFDVTALLPSVRCPTLVLFRRQVTNPPADESRFLASRIPGAQLVALEGHQPLPYVGDMESVLAAIEEFLTRDEPAKEVAAAPLPSGTAIILFADIVSSTALQEQLGNTAFRDRSRSVEERVRERIAGHAGTAVEGRTLGDGVLATFSSASDAINAALACCTVGEEVGLALHLGLHAGDVTRERAPDGRDNVYGQAVSIASRVSDLSAPNEVLVSATVRDLARASSGVSFEDRGERELKGVSEAVRVFAVVSQAEA